MMMLKRGPRLLAVRFARWGRLLVAKPTKKPVALRASEVERTRRDLLTRNRRHFEPAPAGVDIVEPTR